MSPNLLQMALVVSLCAGMIRIVTPILLAALGELVAERSGILNLGVEGTMLMGAFAGFLAASRSGSLWAGLVAAAVAGACLGLILAFMACTLKVDQVVAGLAINLLASGVSFYWFRVAFDRGAAGPLPKIQIFDLVRVPLLAQIPFFGEALFSQQGLTYFALLMTAVVWFFLYRTKYGLIVRCCGENPRAIDVKGVSVDRVQYLAVIFGGMMAGLGGSFLTLASSGMFIPDMSGGRGWLAIVMVIAGNWQPTRILIAGLLFAFLDSFQFTVQGVGVQFPYQALLALPYVVAIVLLTVRRTQSLAPGFLGRPYLRQ